jgi:uncharacterized protein
MGVITRVRLSPRRRRVDRVDAWARIIKLARVTEPPTFASPFWLKNRHLMTITASLVRRPPRLPLYRERWELADGDFLDLDRLDGPTPDAPLVIVCHGLEGSSRASYALGVVQRARAHGLSALAINFRGCSGEPNRLPRFYHSGETTDLGLVVDRLVEERPGRSIGLVGFSLGANVVVKYLGERGDGARGEIRAAAAISTPFDLAACCEAIDARGLPALIYRERFLQTLRPKALEKARRFPGLVDAARVRRARTLLEYDEAVTAPIHGFADAADYYARSSSGPFVASVRRPLLLISAEDDPFVPGASVPVDALRENPCVTPRVSKTGGHLGFLQGPPWALSWWAEEQAIAFVGRHLAT